MNPASSLSSTGTCMSQTSGQGRPLRETREGRRGVVALGFIWFGWVLTILFNGAFNFFSRIYGTRLYVFEALHIIKKSPHPWTLLFLFLLTLVFITGPLNLHGLLPLRGTCGSGVILVHGEKEGLGVPACKRHQGWHRVVVALLLVHGLAPTNGDPLHRRVALPRLVRREGDPLARTPLLPRHAQPLALVEAGAPNQAHAGRLGGGVGEEAPARPLLARVHKAAAGGNGLALRVLYREDAARAVDAGLGRIQVRHVECGVLKPLDLVRHFLLFVGVT